jgi:hypothetical protein
MQSSANNKRSFSERNFDGVYNRIRSNTQCPVLENKTEQHIITNKFDELYYKQFISELEGRVKTLEGKLKMNKIFIYMIIHDLKHPTEAVIQQLNNVDQ